MENIEIRVGYNFGRGTYDIYFVGPPLGERAQIGRLREDGHVEMVSVDPVIDHEPTLRIREDHAVKLIDALTKAGIPPEALVRHTGKTEGLLEEAQRRADLLEKLLLTSDISRAADRSGADHD